MAIHRVSYLRLVSKISSGSMKRTLSSCGYLAAIMTKNTNPRIPEGLQQ